MTEARVAFPTAGFLLLHVLQDSLEALDLAHSLLLACLAPDVLKTYFQLADLRGNLVCCLERFTAEKV